MHVIKRIGIVLATAIGSGLPGAVALQSRSEAPLWYVGLASLFGAVGVGLPAMVFGAIVLLAARSRTEGGVKAAAITTAVVGLLCSASLIYSLHRTQ
jgi:hypothetical protein